LNYSKFPYLGNGKLKVVCEIQKYRLQSPGGLVKNNTKSITKELMGRNGNAKLILKIRKGGQKQTESI
jgi:hypothetical protein